MARADSTRREGGFGDRFTALLPRGGRPVTRWLTVLLLISAPAGCVSMPVLGPALLLAQADRHAREGAWERAVAAYDEYLARFPDDSSAPRVLESRDELAAMLTARAELTRRREEVARLRDELARLQDERARLREDGTRLRDEMIRLYDDRVTLRAEATVLRDQVIRLHDDQSNLRAEGTQLREELTRREDDLARTRQELAAQQAEADRLRADIERLKEIDLQPDRKR
ncbi:MAG: hypothetical protein ACREM3_06085 [Candidatus Rokuibacteriota bacterium]